MLAQTGRRWTRLELPPFEVVSDQGRRDWRRLLKATERQLVLARARPGMLTGLAGYLFEGTSGHIGSFITLITRGCVTAIRTGEEKLTAALLDRVRIDEASEQARRQLAAAFAAGRLSAARPGAANRGPPPRESPAPDAAAAGRDRRGRGPGQLAGGPGRRHQVTVGMLVTALGWHMPASPGRLVSRHPGPGAAPPRAPGRAARRAP